MPASQKLFIPTKEETALDAAVLPIAFRAIERWANGLPTIGSFSGYASLTGPGTTSPTGYLVQGGGFTVNDITDSGINLNTGSGGPAPGTGGIRLTNTSSDSLAGIVIDNAVGAHGDIQILQNANFPLQIANGGSQATIISASGGGGIELLQQNSSGGITIINNGAGGGINVSSSNGGGLSLQAQPGSGGSGGIVYINANGVEGGVGIYAGDGTRSLQGISGTEVDINAGSDIRLIYATSSSVTGSRGQSGSVVIQDSYDPTRLCLLYTCHGNPNGVITPPSLSATVAAFCFDTLTPGLWVSGVGTSVWTMYTLP